MSDETKYVRKCSNWLVDFGRWTLPRSEAPESFIFWTALLTLSAVLKRRVFIPKRYLGSWSAHPNLYVLFIAPAGKARKSTTLNYAEELLDNIPNMTKSPELVTKEALMTRLVKSNDASMYVLAPEFGEFIVKSGPEMFGFLTNMYDGKKNISVGTMTRAEFADKPCINLGGATTPEWVSENMPESVIGGGFASRVIFIAEDKVRRRKLFYDDVDHEELERIRVNLVMDLAHIAENITGEFEFEDSAKTFMKSWYDQNAEPNGVSHKLHGYIERRPAHIFKVAMLVHLAYSDDLVLYKEDLEQAITLVRQTEKNLPSVFQSIGKNPYTVDIYRILEYVTTQGRVTKKQVRQRFMHAATPSMLDELIDGLLAAGFITGKAEDDGEMWLTVVVLTVQTQTPPV
jgi:hypothetical protein